MPLLKIKFKNDRDNLPDTLDKYADSLIAVAPFLCLILLYILLLALGFQILINALTIVFRGL